MSLVRLRLGATSGDFELGDFELEDFEFGEWSGLEARDGEGLLLFSLSIKEQIAVPEKIKISLRIGLYL